MQPARHARLTSETKITPQSSTCYPPKTRAPLNCKGRFLSIKDFTLNIRRVGLTFDPDRPEDDGNMEEMCRGCGCRCG